LRGRSLRTVDPIRCRLLEVFGRLAVIVHLVLAVAKVPEAVPLRAALRVECERIVVDGPRTLLPEFVLERLAAETRLVHAVQRPVGANAHTVYNLASRQGRVLGC
jgi:hypothetical protein